MRILLTTDPIGGVWTFTRELTRQYLKRGHSVALVSFGRELTEAQRHWCGDTMATHQGNFSCRASATPLEWMTQNSRVYEDGAAVLHEVIAEFEPEVIHSSQFCYGRLAVEIPKLITAHSDVFSWAAACRVQGLNRLTWIENYAALVQSGLRGADAVVAPTRWMLNALCSSFDIDCERHVIANGRELAAASTMQRRSLQAVTCGRLWDEGKNLGVLAEVKAVLPIRVAGEQACDGTQPRPSRITRASFVGALGEEELMAMFRRSMIYIATSRYEPFGLAPLEAALSGCAIVAHDIASLREVWADGALYFGDAGELSRTLARLCESPHLLAAARKRSAQRASRYPAATMADRYLSLYAELVDKAEVSNCSEEGAYA